MEKTGSSQVEIAAACDKREISRLFAVSADRDLLLPRVSYYIDPVQRYVHTVLYTCLYVNADVLQ